jgi:FtsZ-binding cell division protein ZapB
LFADQYTREGVFVPLEVISVLEKKIDSLVETVKKLRETNDQLKEELGSKDQTIRALEEEKELLSSSIDSLKGDSEGSQKRLDAAAERIQSIIAKLEAVEAVA